MRATPGLVGGAGIVAGLMYLLGRRRGKRRGSALPGQIRMATTIEAPIERVFDAWSCFEDVPRFTPMVAKVRPVGADRWQWTISESVGASIDFVCSVTQRDRPRLLAWATDGGGVAQHSGTVRFRATAESQTRMKIQIVRRASDGAVGDGAVVATIVDPKRALRKGLAAFKASVEASPANVRR
jgi:uncharacterized membrane protein